MTLPTEILDHILSFLRPDPTTLRTCSKSHPLLSKLAESHLYFHILLMTQGPSSVYRFCPSDLAMLLSQRPYIAHYVRDLEIHVTVSRGTEYHTQFQLETISNILPTLLSLSRITVNHYGSPSSFTWKTQPKSFRLAFWACLRLPSMRHVCLTSVSHFPLLSLLDNQYTSLRMLTLRFCFWTNSNITREDDMIPTGSSHSNGSLPFEYLCLRNNTLEVFTDWSATSRVLRLRSLKFLSDDYKSLPKLLSSCSTSLVNLYLDIGCAGSYFYNVGKYPPTIENPTIDIPTIFPMVPYLEELTIQSPLNLYSSYRRGYGFYSAIPLIAKFFSTKPPSSLKHLTLDFDCPSFVLPQFHPPLSVSTVIRIPLIELLSQVSALSSNGSVSPSIQVDLVLNGNLLTTLGTPASSPPLFSLLRGSEEIMRFFQSR